MSKSSPSRSVTARSAAELIRFIYDSIKVLKHDIIISTNAPAVSAVLINTLSKYAPFDNPVSCNEKFSLPAVVSFMTSAIEMKGQGVTWVTIVPKKIQVGMNLPSMTTRIIVDDAGVFLGEVMGQIEIMKDESNGK